MGRYRRHKKENYTHIDNHVFMDHSLSLKAKGLLTQIYSLPDDWEYSVKGLATLFSDGKDAVNNALQELIEHGYIVRSQRFNEFGKFDGYEYDIYEEPHIIEAESTITENPSTGNPITENPPQLNTNKENTKESNTKLIKKENIQKKEKFDAFKEFSSVDEIKNDPELLQTFKEFVDMRNEIKKPIKSMKGVNGILNELRKLSNGNHRMMIEIIKQSIDHEWCGVFEVKRQTSNNSNKTCFGEMMEREGINPKEIIYGKSGDFNFT